jgi:lipid-A-disaccharide synthase
VAGEVSGDALGADLIKAIKAQYPNVYIEGIAGPLMMREGCVALHAMERLSVMGLIEPLRRLPELIMIRKQIQKHFLSHPPDLFIGIDAPDFNLGLERVLHQNGIPTVHYVSPSVWAWRQNRIHGIKKSVDLMLCLFPFEADFYKQHQVPVCYVGHPLAEQIPLHVDVEHAKKTLGLVSNAPQTIITLLPGSRNSELKYMAPLYCQSAQLLHEQYLQSYPGHSLQFLVPLVSEAHQRYFQSIQQKYAPHLSFTVQVGQVREAIAAAEVVLVTSGTATLEVMLHKKPMVVAFQMHPLTFSILKHLVKVPYIALPNLLAQEFLVPEFIQTEATPHSLCRMLMHYLQSPKECERLKKRFTELHLQLKQGGSETAIRAIIERFS